MALWKDNLYIGMIIWIFTGKIIEANIINNTYDYICTSETNIYLERTTELECNGLSRKITSKN